MTRYASWGIIIDDIVFPRGETAMGVLGGAGLYAAVGMRLWTPDVTLISAVGHDFDTQSLRAHGLDDSGLQTTEFPTPRAWQLFEEDGRRTQIFRVPDEAVQAQLVQAPLSWPLPSGIEAVHYMLRGSSDEEKMVLSLARQKGLCLSAEPIVDADTTAEERQVILRCLPHFELFSPDEEGAALLVGERSPQEQLRRLAALGPRLVALRQGAAGSLVYECESDVIWRVPAAPATVVDITGAGNAYCGGLLVGWNKFGEVRRAAAMATVGAAMTIEQVGPPRVDGTTMVDAKERLAQIVDRIKPLAKEDRYLEKEGNR